LPNRYANLVGSNKISTDYTKINDGFQAVQDEMDSKAPASVGTTLTAHIGSRGAAHGNATQTEAGFMSAADKSKLNGIEAGAEKNKPAFSHVNDVTAGTPEDTLTVEGGTGITVTTNPTTKKMTITATGTATPGAHGPSHTEFGSDPIPNATPSEGGLMSAADKTKLDGMDGDFDDLAGPGRTTETVKGNADAIASLNAGTVTNIVNAVTGHGADRTGVTDSSAALNAAASAAAGGVLYIPPGSYKISATINIPTNVTVSAYGARVFNTSSHITLLSLGSNLEVIGLELEGAGNSAYNSSGVAISVVGASAANRAKDITLRDCNIHDVGFYGVYMEFVDGATVDHCQIKNVAYGGVVGLSVSNVTVTRSRIKGVSPGFNNNAYGVAYTRHGSSSDLTTYPRSAHCTVSDCRIEDITLWEGLDTHGGEYISFINNRIKNCKVGIAIVAAPYSGGGYAAKYCQAIGNRIDGITTGAGIIVAGASNTVGNPYDYVTACVILGNVLYRCGVVGNSNSGGIYLDASEATVVQGNTLTECYANGVIFNNTNRGFSCTGNTIIDPQDTTWANAAGICIRTSYNTGTIDGNTLLRINDALNTYVSEIGIFVNTSGTNYDLYVGVNQNNFVIQMVGLQGEYTKFGSLGNNIFVYAHTATPEGVIGAAIGSLCINRNGGAGTTFFVKQTGAGNTGWVGK